jgi:hypothetical protein
MKANFPVSPRNWSAKADVAAPSIDANVWFPDVELSLTHADTENGSAY